LNPDGSFNYIPAGGFTGPDTFTYKIVSDFTPDSAPATVTINVIAALPLVANDDNYEMTLPGSLGVEAANGVLSNDTTGGDAEQVPPGAIAVLVDAPPSTEASAFNLNPDGSFTYSPAPGFTGTTSFQYKINYGETDSAPATVTITVNPPAEPAPTLLGTADLPGNAAGGVVIGTDGTAYQITRTGDAFLVTAIDPNDPTNPTTVDVPDVDSTAGVAVGPDGTIYQTSESPPADMSGVDFVTHVTAINPSDPTNPAPVDDVAGRALGAVVVGPDGILYQFTRVGTQLGDPGHLAAHVIGPGTTTDVPLPGDLLSDVVFDTDGIAYVVTREDDPTGFSGIHITVIDPNDPNNPTTISSAGFAAGRLGVGAGAVYQNHFVASGYQMRVVDPDDPTNFIFIALPGEPQGAPVVRADGLAYQTVSTSTGYAIVVVDPATQTTSDPIDIPGDAIGGVVAGPGDRAYQTSLDGSGVHVTMVDPADLTNPTTVDVAGFSSGAVVVGADGTVVQTTTTTGGDAGTVSHVTVFNADLTQRTTIDNIPGEPFGPPVVGDDGTVYQTVRTPDGTGGFVYQTAVIGIASSAV
jgi:hypothetical protein